MKHAGQKSVKEELPEQRKGPKRAVECRLKVQTHVWEQDAAGSNPVTRTILFVSKLWRYCMGAASVSEYAASTSNTAMSSRSIPLRKASATS